jgi:hypothetical protein
VPPRHRFSCLVILVPAAVISRKAVLQAEDGRCQAQTWRGAIQRRNPEDHEQGSVGEADKTKAVTLPGGVVRALDDSELASVVGGQRPTTTRSNSCSGGCEDDCVD